MLLCTARVPCATRRQAQHRASDLHKTRSSCVLRVSRWDVEYEAGSPESKIQNIKTVFAVFDRLRFAAKTRSG